MEASGYGSLTTNIQVPDQPYYEPHPLSLFNLGEQSQILFLVRDAQGQLIENARIVNQANPETVLEVEDGIGSITVEPDTYSWIVSADGFQSQVSPARVAEGSVASVSVTLASLQPQGSTTDSCIAGDYIRIEGTADLVFFDTGEHALRPDSLDLLNSVAQCIVEHPEIEEIEVIGHADPRGDQTANQALSERRANQVQAYLESRLEERVGDGLILTSHGMGEEQLLQPGDSETALQTDRRVEFRIVRLSETSE